MSGQRSPNVLLDPTRGPICCGGYAMPLSLAWIPPAGSWTASETTEWCCQRCGRTAAYSRCGSCSHWLDVAEVVGDRCGSCINDAGQFEPAQR